ncbi:hypothetical protein [Nonomuraea sp. NPDC049129]|uniref:hypothetical protein n=1 Tax=Nonomuraea sp. NPDC049129 TaxID=3155272 RepID=UPI0034031C40
MTGSWLTLSAAASRISDVTGQPVSLDDVHRLAGDGLLTVSWLHDHYGVLKSSLTAYLSTVPASELAAHGGDDLAESKPRPTWTAWTDPDYRREQADYDTTPNAEGDDEQ